MGSFVVLHATKVRPDPNKFKALPKKLDCAFYSDDETGAFYIDTFVAGKKKEWPSAWTIYTKDIPLDLPVALEPLNVVYGALSKKGFSHDYSFERGFINLNLLLSQIHGHSVCSICGDDDTLDLACISTCGRLDRL